MKKKTIRMATKHLPNGQWDKASWDRYLKAREDLLDDVFDAAKALGWSDDELAKQAKPASSTVWNIAYYHTADPRFSTVYKLAKAVGMNVGLLQQTQSKQRRA